MAPANAVAVGVVHDTVCALRIACVRLPSAAKSRPATTITIV